jgi:hypothetical protein
MNIKNIIGIFLITLIISCSPKTKVSSSKGEKVGKTIEVNNKNIDWELFESSSTISKSEIKLEHLQGLWNAYKGVYKFGESVNAMELVKPMILEVKNDTYRRNSEGIFENFIIDNNMIIKKSESKIDTGIINKITPTELVVSWKNKANYTRYYYGK